jgi:hypothetical protein
MEDYPACIDCKFAHKDGSWMCSKFLNNHVDYVTGKKWQSYYTAHYQRTGGKCGKEARAFEPKVKSSFWQRIINFL